MSDRGHIGLTRIEAKEAGVEALGYVLENSWLGSVLLSAATASNIAFYGGSKVKTVKPMAKAVEIDLEGQNKTSHLDTKLLIMLMAQILLRLNSWVFNFIPSPTGTAPLLLILACKMPIAV